jgi:hypothetical protein
LINNRQGGRRRGRGGGSGPPRSNNPGPGNRQDNRQRGNAAQLLEKYKGLARDAQMQGDRVLTENYLQFADHYFRVLNENRARYEEQRPRQRDDYQDDYEGEDGDGGREANDRYAGDGDEDGGREPEPRYEREPRREPEPRYEPEPRREAEPRPERAQRPDRAERPDRADRPDRNGEYRANRRPPVRRPARDEEADEERIALDVLPPAISAANEGGEAEAPARAPRPRRPRRPRDADEDIAPAA